MSHPYSRKDFYLGSGTVCSTLAFLGMSSKLQMLGQDCGPHQPLPRGQGIPFSQAAASPAHRTHLASSWPLCSARLSVMFISGEHRQPRLSLTTTLQPTEISCSCCRYFHQACMMNVAFNFSRIDLKIDSALCCLRPFHLTDFLVLSSRVFNCAVMAFDSF